MPAALPPSASSLPARDLRFDTVRGVLLLVMAINHVGSDLSRVLDQPFGFVSAAEGFVFLAGILAGRTDHGLGGDFPTLARRARRRAWRAYLWHAVALVVVWLWVRLWLAGGEERPWALPYLFHEGGGWWGLFGGLALLYQPGLLDILPMYVGFPLLVPLVLRFHAAGRGLTIWLVSGAIWGLDQWLSPPHPIVWKAINTGAFHFLAWQWLFVTGVLLGAEPKWERAAISRPRAWMVVAALAGGLFLWTVRRPEFPNWWDDSLLEAMTRKTPLAALRLMDFGLVAYLLAIIGSRHPRWLEAEPLALLGRHSLPVFTASIWCAQLALSYPCLADTWTGRMLKTAFVVGGVVAAAAGCEVYRRWLAQRRPAAPTGLPAVGPVSVPVPVPQTPLSSRPSTAT